MRTSVSIHREHFGGLMIHKVDKKFLELTKMSDDDLYRRIGESGRRTVSSITPSTIYLASPNFGDTEGKSAAFFQHEKIEATSPDVYFDHRLDDLEGGKMIFRHLEKLFDRVVCETVTNSPLYGYKQEVNRLGSQCNKAICKKYPGVDKRIVEAFVAIRMKGFFAVCAMY
jgi:hypothetical protein